MPRFDQDDATQTTMSGFQYTSVPKDKLDSDRYVIAGTAVDISGSVRDFARIMEQCLKNIVIGCKAGAGKNNILYRTLQFNEIVSELHGEKIVRDINESIFDNVLKPYGSTAARQATLEMLEYAERESVRLKNLDIFSNAVIYIITDGDDNASYGVTNKKIKDTVERLRKSERLTSVIMILVGVNVQEKRLSNLLHEFKDEAGFDHYIEIDNASPSALGKLGDMISQSISSASQNVMSGSTAGSVQALGI